MRYVAIFFILMNILCAKEAGEIIYKESNIPVLDLSEYFDDAKKNDFIKKVRSALHKVGFFAVTNTGVNQKDIDNLYLALKIFFTHPFEKKNEVCGEKTNNQRGYTLFGAEAAKGSSVGDNKEFYSIGREITKEKAESINTWPNIWPKYMDLKGPANIFFNIMDEYSVLFQEIFSLALRKDPGFLEKICLDGDSSCRMIHYPINRKIDRRAQWAKEHTDIDLFTILPKATVQGLEVFDDKNGWRPVFVREDAFIINAGDFLEIFSNGYFKSARHRVIAPENMKTDRYSSVFFSHPRSEALLYPLPQWVEYTGGKAKYIKATRLEMLMERLADLNLASDDMLRALADSQVLERLLLVNRASLEAMSALDKAGYASDIIKKELIKHK